VPAYHTPLSLAWPALNQILLSPLYRLALHCFGNAGGCSLRSICDPIGGAKHSSGQGDRSFGRHQHYLGSRGSCTMWCKHVPRIADRFNSILRRPGIALRVNAPLRVASRGCRHREFLMHRDSLVNRAHASTCQLACQAQTVVVLTCALASSNSRPSGLFSLGRGTSETHRVSIPISSENWLNSSLWTM